jgi:tetratricopeptide (TPR) repeat protein
MSAMPPTPPWRTADVDSYPPQQLGGGAVSQGGFPYGVSQQEEAAWASSAAAERQLGEAVPRSVTGPMIAAMQGSDDPRFQQSQLLDMLKQMDAGKLHLGEAGLHGAAKAQAQAPELDAAWAEAGAAGAAGAALQAGSPLESAWSQAVDQAGDGEGMMQAWHDALHEDGIDSSLPEMEALWAALKGGEHGDFESAWDPSLLEAGYDDYSFAPVNPFLGQEVPGGLLALGTELFARGELSQAVLALEAAVQRSPDDSIGWQTLGQAHADSDEDNRAIGCLRRAVSSDPHNLEALLALGVSYTNELDQSRALHHLQHWLESHPDFASLGLSVEPAAKANPFRLQQQAPRQHGHRMGTTGHTIALHRMCTACAPHVHRMCTACAPHTRCRSPTTLHALSRTRPPMPTCTRCSVCYTTSRETTLRRWALSRRRCSCGRRTTPCGTSWARRKPTRWSVPKRCRATSTRSSSSHSTCAPLVTWASPTPT